MSDEADRELSDAMLDTLVALERHRVAPPLTEWHALATRLRDEGIIRLPEEKSFNRAVARSGRTIVPFRRYSVATRWGVRIAASVALLGAGVVLGRGWTGGSKVVHYAKGDVQHTVGAPEGATAIPSEATQITTPVANSASATADAAAVLQAFHSPDEARRAMANAAAAYQRAAAYLAVVGTSTQGARQQPAQVQIRLAALDLVLSATQQALKEAPHDPVIKQYYASSVSAHQATLQQLSQSLPAGAELTSY